MVLLSIEKHCKLRIIYSIIHKNKFMIDGSKMIQYFIIDKNHICCPVGAQVNFNVQYLQPAAFLHDICI